MLRTAPFVVAGLGALLLSLVDVERPVVAGVAAVLGLAVSAAALWLPWRGLPAWAPAALTLLVLAAVGLLLVGEGDLDAGTVSMVMLPVLWLALFGSRGQLVVVLAAVPVAIVVPGLVVGLPIGETVRTAVVVTAVATAVGLAGHALIEEVRRRRRAEAAGHDRIRRILDTSEDTAVLTWSQDRLVTGMNRGAERLFGFRAAEAVGRLSPADLLGDEAVAALARELGFGNPLDPGAVLDDLLLSDRWDAESRAVHGVSARLPGGLPRVAPAWVRMDLGAVTDERGAVTEYVLVAHDVTDLHRATDDLESAERDLATVVEVLHDAQAGGDVRASVCRKTRELTGADTVAVFELRGRDLVVTAQEGADLGELTVPLDGAPSAAALAFSNGRRLEIVDTATDPRVSQALVRRYSVRSLLYEPIRQDGRVVALLGLMWQTPRDRVSDRLSTSVWMLASEAGLALRRERDVRRLADHTRLDQLTGLPNRREWDRLLAELYGDPGPLCLAMLDLDRFKDWNDARGHQSGDRLLAAAAAAWRASLRSTDVIARYGGEEFAVLLPGCTDIEARDVLDRLRGATPMGATVSVGLAARVDGEAPEVLVGRADAALYRAKAEGRDRLVLAPATPAALAGHRGPDATGCAP